MKRFLFVLAVVAATAGALFYAVPRTIYSDVSNYALLNATVSVYCRQTDLPCVTNGLANEVTCTVEDFAQTLTKCKQTDGVSVSFDGGMREVEAVMRRLQAKVVNVQQLGDVYVVTCYSCRLSGKLYLDGAPVNVQIASHGGRVTVGYPLILGSY